jgi:hypothetical protein
MGATLPTTMANPGRKGATYADVLAAPDHRVAELVDQVLHTSPRPSLRHAMATSSLHGDLQGPFGRGRHGPGGWIILVEPELHLGGDILVPDVAGWRRTRMPECPVDAFTELAPDWLCETLSPSTAGFDRGEKLAVYARERVERVWLVDPIARTLEVLALDGRSYRLHAVHHGDAVIRAEPFDAIELDLAGWWLPT